MLETAGQLRASFSHKASDTLITKIMLGVFGCVPAFDTYFCKGCHVSGFNLKALRKIGRFYDDNADLIDEHVVTTLDFGTGAPTSRPYTRAKKIDMIFLFEGRR